MLEMPVTNPNNRLLHGKKLGSSFVAAHKASNDKIVASRYGDGLLVLKPGDVRDLQFGLARYIAALP